jgi:hypothetical protein
MMAAKAARKMNLMSFLLGSRLAACAIARPPGCRELIADRDAGEMDFTASNNNPEFCD